MVTAEFVRYVGMHVTAYRLTSRVFFGLTPRHEDWLPAVPEGLVTTEGPVWRRDPEEKFFQVDLQEPVEVPHGNWMGIDLGGKCVVLSPEEEPKWRITRATAALERLQRPEKAASALASVNMMHAAASLIGVSIPSLHSELARVRKTANEPLETTVKALVEEMTKQRQSSGL
jgi:hypothetical protein